MVMDNFDSFDTNGDGTLDLDEGYAMYAALDPNAGPMDEFAP